MRSHKDINVLLVPYEGVDDFMWGTNLEKQVDTESSLI